MKLHGRDQLNKIRIIFGGGGNCENPYQRGVLWPFSSSDIFREPLDPIIISIPIPKDLNIGETETRWMRRLTVAYGLSFEKNELFRFIYPKDVQIPSPEEIWNPIRITNEAPTLDQC